MQLICSTSHSFKAIRELIMHIYVCIYYKYYIDI